MNARTEAENYMGRTIVERVREIREVVRDNDEAVRLLDERNEVQR